MARRRSQHTRRRTKSFLSAVVYREAIPLPRHRGHDLLPLSFGATLLVVCFWRRWLMLIVELHAFWAWDACSEGWDFSKNSSIEWRWRRLRDQECNSLGKPFHWVTSIKRKQYYIPLIPLIQYQLIIYNPFTIDKFSTVHQASVHICGKSYASSMRHRNIADIAIQVSLWQS